MFVWPVPSCPELPSPQAYIFPDDMQAVWWDPHDIKEQFDNGSFWGFSYDNESPKPKTPISPDPHIYTDPLDVSAAKWSFPEEIEDILCGFRLDINSSFGNIEVYKSPDSLKYKGLVKDNEISFMLIGDSM